MKISLIHPSRGRPIKALETCIKWFKNANSLEIEHILIIDSDDKNLKKYIRLFGAESKKTKIVVNHEINSNTVTATNLGAKESSGDILIYMSDDFDCPGEWDEKVEAFMSERVGPTLLKVNDGLQKFEVKVLTIPIMNRELYNKLGYFWHPEYKSMFVDEDLYCTCEKYGWLIFAPHLMFQHYHYSVGKAPKDETYTRSDKNWNQGKALFAKRKRLKFPL